MTDSLPAGSKPRIVILGGGFGGAYAAHALRKHARRGDFDVVLIDRNNYLLFYPLLIEAGAGAIEPRHVVVPIRKFAPDRSFLMADVTEVDLGGSQVRYRVAGETREASLHFDHLVIALGSVTRVPTQIAGMREFGFEIKSLTDAVSLRDRAIRLLEMANTVGSKDARRDLLRTVVVGASFTGIEFAGEYEAFLKGAAREYSNIDPDEIEVIVLEHGQRILPAMPERLANWAEAALNRRGVKVLRQTSVKDVDGEGCTLTTGDRLPSQTVVWAAGIAPNPLLSQIQGLPLNEKGYIDCERTLQVRGWSNVWAIGDAATVMGENGRPYAATAQNASRQGPHVADNVCAAMEGRSLRTFNFRTLGSFAAIGNRQAVAEVFGATFTGFLGWFLFRGAYLVKMPTLALKARIAMDWALEIILPSPPAQMGIHRRIFDTDSEREALPAKKAPTLY